MKTKRRQVMLYVLLTALLTIATVWDGRIRFKDSETLTFAVGPPDDDDARFVAKLANLLKSNHSWPTDGLDTFKLGFELVRDEIGMRRDYLKRHAGDCTAQDDNVAVVKTARSA